jgi:predicted nucleotide-binding protein (sugar kinase/HSP70/actin superfamily)
LENLVVEPKTLGWGHSKKFWEKFFENLGVEFYFTEVFSRKWFYMDGVEKGENEKEVL